MYDDVTLAQWASSQLNNTIQIEDPVTLTEVPVQVALALRDIVFIPCPTVRSAWALPVTQIE